MPDTLLDDRDESNRGRNLARSGALLRILQDCVSRPGSRDERLHEIAAALRQSGNYRWVGLYDVDRSRGIVINLVWKGLSPPEFPRFDMDKGLTGRAIRRRATVNVGEVARDADYLTALATTRSEIIVPVFDQHGAVAGTIDIESELPDAFPPAAQELLEQCAELIRPLWIPSATG